MADMLAETLSGKSVMGADGTELGKLYNVTMDLESGRIENLLVEPLEEGSAHVDFPQDESGRFQIPVARVQAVKDYIVVDR
ncbi:MAG: PRC-barrel domain-containing protein [Halobacteriota archaeon]|uniref:PRC-barrel domain protein n=1 Tax=Halodesulfurarchaeum formicicum TaxID=1873524 RepID=A0A1D8S1X8_9EURY|nr:MULTISPECIES: PRC-barrel domain-containing protein [Halodesulfurarchaeum]AOW79343.1 PRC-barrel domain protein [Halodesulfurarchaeum formicicum]APE94610.1 PRC-barrel domain protein [Halodesulfurarchaeum formicicum]MDR5656020.1 PRC-barrel domain-containing protein [Halodesulfurarchaeum sp. HSR-GB]